MKRHAGASVSKRNMKRGSKFFILPADGEVVSLRDMELFYNVKMRADVGHNRTDKVADEDRTKSSSNWTASRP